MRLWIYKLSEFTPWDVVRYGERKSRYTLLAEAMAAAGHEVIWWTDDFTHHAKERGHRFGKDHYEQVTPYIGVRWITSKGYAKNVSVGRFRDHQNVARKMLDDAGNWPSPDLILGAMPTDTMSAVAVALGERFDVPVVLDVRDQWPDIFSSQIPKIFRSLLWVLTRKMQKRVEGAFCRATAITGNTDAFVNWGLKMGRRDRSNLDQAFPIGYMKSLDVNFNVASAEKFWNSHQVFADDGVLNICFLGAFSNMYDFDPIVLAADILEEESAKVRFIMCGAGENLIKLRRKTRHLSNVVLPGRVAGDELRYVLEYSDLGIIPYIDHENFRGNIANKPAEYLAYNLPILISIDGVLTDLIQEYGCGNKYENGKHLAQKIWAFLDDDGRLEAFQKRAGVLFSERLDAKKIYSNFAKHLGTIYEETNR